MIIHQNFTGGNIAVERVENDTVYLERELRDTEGDWFYWAFCAERCAGRTMTFVFPSQNRVGRFGAAVSHDLVNWRWSDSGSGDRFTYTFGEEENTVYFAHDMVYVPGRFERFCAASGLETEVFCQSVKGRDLPAVRFGEGDKWILLTARHHACESTGSHVLEGAAEVLLKELPAGYSVLVVPYVDYDGAMDGDQGKNRRPHDHNRDYTDSPVYEVVRRLMDFGNERDLRYTFDFHSPWHMGRRHDHIYISHSLEAMEPCTGCFAEILKRETAGGQLKYTGKWDVGPNQEWNNENNPNCKNYFSRLPSVRLSVTLETPYFGPEDGRISQEAMLELGRAFGRSVIEYIRTDQ